MRCAGFFVSIVLYSFSRSQPAARRKTADERVLATMWREENGVLQAIHDEVEGRKIADKRLEAMMYAGLLP